MTTMASGTSTSTSSHIECDDLLALATACSVDDHQAQLSADLRNQLSMTLLCHISQAQGGSTAPACAPATTPTTTSTTTMATNAMVSDPPSSSPWLSDPHARYEAYRRAYDGAHHPRRPSPVRTRSRHLQRSDEDDDMDTTTNADADWNPPVSFEDSDGMLVEQPEQLFRHSGPGYDFSDQVSKSPSIFVSTDPFYLAVQQSQAASQSKRKLQARPFAMQTPLQVSPNPPVAPFGTGPGVSQFGSSSSSSSGFHAQPFGSHAAFPASNNLSSHDSFEWRAAKNVSWNQYR